MKFLNPATDSLVPRGEGGRICITLSMSDDGIRTLIHKPAVCYFCKDVITQYEGVYGDSLAIHSIDGNHDNWDPDNKVPAHMKCHISWHAWLRTSGEDVFPVGDELQKLLELWRYQREVDIPSKSNRGRKISYDDLLRIYWRTEARKRYWRRKRGTN